MFIFVLLYCIEVVVVIHLQEPFRPNSLLVEPTSSSTGQDIFQNSMKATVENPRGSVEKLSPKESVEGVHKLLAFSSYVWPVKSHTVTD